MKKLFTLLSLLALIGLSANVFAQADATHYPGSIHTFSVNDNSSGGFTYDWDVYPTTALGTPVGTGYNLSNETTAEVTIEWTSITTGTYYVGVTETNPNGCSTKRYVEIDIAAASYDLVVTAVDASGNVVADLDECMSGSGQILSQTDNLVTTGTNERYYKVLLTNDGTNPWIDGSWKFDYTLTGLDSNSPANETISSVEVVGAPSGVTGVSGSAAASATTVNVSNLGEFTIKVTTNDNPGTSTDFDVNLIFTGSNLKVGAGEIVETGTEANTQTYILRTYPTTSTITIN